MKNMFLLGLAIGAAYVGIDSMASMNETMRAIDAQSFEHDRCVQVYDSESDNEIIEKCKAMKGGK